MIKLIAALGIAALLSACSSMGSGYASNSSSTQYMGSSGSQGQQSLNGDYGGGGGR